MDKADKFRIELDRRLFHPDHSGDQAFWLFVQDAWSKMQGDPNARRFVPMKLLEVLCTKVFYPIIAEPDTWPSQTLINIPPSHAKSVLCNVLFPAWTWTVDPTKAFGHITYDAEGVVRDANKCRALMRSKWYSERWPEAAISQGKDRVHYYWNKSGGYRHCGTLRMGITGKHYDIAICDDLVNPSKLGLAEIGESNSESEHAIEFLSQVLPSRILGESAKFVTVMQRLSELDPAQYLIDKYEGTGNLKHVMLPLHFDPERADPLDWRTERGELLSPERFSADFWESRLSDFPIEVYQAQYQQNATATGTGMFSKEDFLYWESFDQLPLDGSWSVSIDAAVAGADSKNAHNNSYWVGQIWLKHGQTRYLVRQVRFQEAFVTALGILTEFINGFAYDVDTMRRSRGVTWVPDVCIVEEKALGPAIINSWQSYGVPAGLKLLPFNPKTKTKAERATACLPTIRAHRVSIPKPGATSISAGCSGLLERLLPFPRGKTDDEADAMTQYLLYNMDRNLDLGMMLKNMRLLKK